MECYSICGIPFLLQGAASPAREAVVAMFSCLPRLRAQRFIEIAVYQPERGEALASLLPPWLRTRIETLAEDDGVTLVYGEAGDCAALAANRQAVYCAWLRADTRKLSYVALKKTDALTPLSVSSVLVPVLREFFATRGWSMLHAAALQTVSGQGVLLMADSGGGKTTTALALLRAGARLLADDLVVLRADAGAVHLHGIPEALNLTPKTMDFFPEAAAAAAAQSEATVLPNGKRVLRADAIYPHACLSDSCRLHAICFLRIGGNAPQLQPLDTATAFGRLLHAHTFARGQRPLAAAMTMHSRALEAAPAFELLTGPDPRALGPWLMEALA